MAMSQGEAVPARRLDRDALSIFLAEAGTILDASLDYGDTLRRVARMTVPRLADWCVVDLVEDDRLCRLAVAHVDPEKEELAWRLGERYPPSLDDDRGVGKVIRSNAPELTPQVTDEMLAVSARDGEHLRILRAVGLESAMVVPLRARNRTIGALSFVSSAPARRYDADTLRLATALAGRCAIAIDNARLYRQAREAERRSAESLALIDTLFAKAPIGLAYFDCDLRFVRVNDRLAEMNGVPAEDHLGRTVLEVLPDMDSAMVRGLRRVLDHGEPVIDMEINGETPAAPGQERHWLASYYPVRDADGETLGLGAVVNEITERKRGERERNDLLGQLAAMARTDPLTSLPNRRVWQEELPRELARAERDDEPLCIAVVDLDHFKRFNDAHGHQEGDRLLAEAAAAWREELREVDLLARLGGEEFGVVLPHCRLDEAREVIDRLRHATPAGETCSAGIAEWDGYELPSALFARADDALYSAKEAGRDRTTA
jgi:diguanylate cyclase (GGDEF)-like protein/PAS domain S-box-containing protein